MRFLEALRCIRMSFFRDYDEGGLADSVARQDAIMVGSVVFYRSLSIQTMRYSRYRFLKFLEVELTSFISVTIMEIEQRFYPLLLSEY